MKHELKTSTEFFEESWNENKQFEIRENDRDFHVNDWIILREFDLTSELYTGRSIEGKISYITSFDQREGIVVFSLIGVRRYEKPPTSK